MTVFVVLVGPVRHGYIRYRTAHHMILWSSGQGHVIKVTPVSHRNRPPLPTWSNERIEIHVEKNRQLSHNCLHLQNGLCCVGWGVKLYSLTRLTVVVYALRENAVHTVAVKLLWCVCVDGREPVLSQDVRSAIHTTPSCVRESCQLMCWPICLISSSAYTPHCCCCCWRWDALLSRYWKGNLLTLTNEM